MKKSASPSFLVSNSEGLQSLWWERLTLRAPYPLTFSSLFPLIFRLNSPFPIPYHRCTVNKEAAMERLETKQVKGHTYYYYSQWE